MIVFGDDVGDRHRDWASVSSDRSDTPCVFATTKPDFTKQLRSKGMLSGS